MWPSSLELSHPSQIVSVLVLSRLQVRKTEASQLQNSAVDGGGNVPVQQSSNQRGKPQRINHPN